MSTTRGPVEGHGQQHSTDAALTQPADSHASAPSLEVPRGATLRHDPPARQRDPSPRYRLDLADRRDEVAERRDVAAQMRDDEAAARNLAMAQLDAAAAEEEQTLGSTGATAMIRAAGRRRRAAARRAQAAAYRELAAADRTAAARDRAAAARERLDALEDREALAVELQRERRSRDVALRDQRRAETLARTLQRALSPTSLPPVAGLDVAVHFEPFAPEEVGGDFYDLFALAPGRVGFFLGDVCGKGPDAAAVTSLARFTMRTAAMLDERPDAILRNLNSALHMHGDEELTCTAVYGQIELRDATASIVLAVAGHPAPLIVRANGSVETTPAHGTMLGAVERPVFTTAEVSLAPGDTIVLFSDGILDIAIDGVRLDEPRICDLLAGPPATGAADLVARLRRAGQHVDPRPRDDVAVLAMRRTPPA